MIECIDCFGVGTKIEETFAEVCVTCNGTGELDIDDELFAFCDCKFCP